MEQPFGNQHDRLHVRALRKLTVENIFKDISSGSKLSGDDDEIDPNLNKNILFNELDVDEIDVHPDE